MDHQPVAARRGRAPQAVAIAVAAAVLLAWPVAGTQLPVVPGLTAAWGALVFAGDLVGAILLVGLYRSGRGLRMLVLAAAFAWSAVVVAMLMVTVPGVMGVTPLLGEPFTSTGWLWVSRHVGPPVLVALALAPWPHAWEERAAAADEDPVVRRRVLAALGAVMLLGPVALGLEVVLDPGLLPEVADATGRFSPVAMALVAALNVVVVLVAAYGVARRRERSDVEVWAIVAAVAGLGDVALVAMYEPAYSLAFFGARALGVLGSLVLPVTILADTWYLHRRLISGNADLARQVDRLLEAQRLRDHVAAVVSHDMRTPLAGLHGYLEVLNDDPGLTPDLVERMHQRSLLLTRRLTLLTEDLLAATTADHGDLVLDGRDLDLAGELAEAATGFPRLDLRIDCPAGVPVHADPLRLQQVLSNLIRNAEKHGAEPVVVTVTPPGPSGGPAAPSDQVTIRVSDAGDGVPEAFVPRLFERYAQGARTAGGAGIGLSIVHDLVQAHHGTIRYDLTDPAFIVTLPTGALPSPPDGRVIQAPTGRRS